MAHYSRWEDIKKRKGEPSEQRRAGIEQEFALGQLIYAVLGQFSASVRWSSELKLPLLVISRLEEGWWRCAELR